MADGAGDSNPTNPKRPKHKIKRVYLQEIIIELGIEVTRHPDKEHYFFHIQSIINWMPEFFEERNREKVFHIIHWLQDQLPDYPGTTLLLALSELTGYVASCRVSGVSELLTKKELHERADTINKKADQLIDALEDERTPNHFLRANWYFAPYRDMWVDKDVAFAIKAWCDKNNMVHPNRFGLNHLLKELKKDINHLKTIKPNDTRRNFGDVESRVLSKRIAEYLDDRFNPPKSPDLLITHLVNLLNPQKEVGVDEVHSWIKNMKKRPRKPLIYKD